MAQRRRTNNVRRQNYINGTAITRENIAEVMNQQFTVIDPQEAAKQEKVKGYNFFDIPRALLIMACFIAAALMSVSSITTYTILTKKVSNLESELDRKRLTNEENKQRIDGSINLEEVKRIAVEELGMTYATDGQVIIVSDEGCDYVRQMEELPLN